MLSSAWLLFALSTRFILPAASSRDNNKNEFDNCQVGLHILLEIANCVQVFSTLCQKGHTLENLLFLLEWQELKKLEDPKEVEEKIISIYNNYVKDNYTGKAANVLAHVCINISGPVRSFIEKKVTEINANRKKRGGGERGIPYFGDTNTYDGAETEIAEILTQSTYQQLKKMKYKDFEKVLRPKESGKIVISSKGENR